MVRINLLPADILERRKYERWYPAVIIPGIIMLLIVVAVWGILQFVATQRSRELQAIEDNTAALQTQAESYRVFEEQETALKEREQVAQSAITGRIDMGKFAEEISVVLPEEVFVKALSANEIQGMLLDASVPRAGGTNMATSFKATAATLVRLNALDALYDVWLTTAEIGEYNGFQGISGEGDASVEVVDFSATAKLLVPTSPATATAPAAPAAPAQ